MNHVVNYSKLKSVIADVNSLEVRYGMNKCAPTSNMGIPSDGDDLFISFSDTMELDMFIDMLTRLKEGCGHMTSYTTCYVHRDRDDDN